MLLRDQVLKQVTADVFQEANPPDDRNRPLEWRRRLNSISLPLKSIAVATRFNVNDRDFESDKSSRKAIKPHVSKSVSIKALVDTEVFRDSIRVAIQNNEDKSLYSLKGSGDYIEVTLGSGTPVKDIESLPEGIFDGYVLQANYEPDLGKMYFGLTAPSEQVEELAKKLESSQHSKLNVIVLVDSFTFEVDDALGEPWYPKDLIIPEHTHCYLSVMEVEVPVGESQVSESDDEEDLYELDEEAIGENELKREQMLAISNVLNAISAIETNLKPLGGLVLGIWALVIVMIISLFR